MMHNQTVRATVFKANGTAPQTKQIYEDDFSELYGEGIIAPPYNIIELKTIAEYSTILQQCIDAYRVNITGFGFDVEYTFDVNASDVDQTKKKRAEKDWSRLEAFYKCLHFDESAEMILGYAIEDREKTGNGFMEVLRDGMGKPAGIEYLDVKNMRVCGAGEPVEVSFMYEENGKMKRIKRQKRFRKFVQMINGKKVFFKEYGDPRKMDMRTGEYVNTLAEKYQANEAIHFKIGSGVYGVPRWVGNIVNLYGARKAEELNFMYFKQGRHVPAAITVENGMLSEASYRELQEYMNDLEGVENAHKFLLIEAEGIAKEKDLHGGEDITPVSVEIKSLAEILQNDALFLEYDEKSRNKLRSAFRLPPLYTGEAQEYNRATADTARKITEEQVFQPERKTLVNKLNTLLLPELNIHDVRLTLKGPDFRDPLEIAKVLGPFITAGAVSPNDLRDLAGRVLGKTLEEWPEEIYKRPAGQDAEKTNLTALMQELKESIEDIKTS